jgi:uncharacterized protein YkwD
MGLRNSRAIRMALVPVSVILAAAIGLAIAAGEARAQSLGDLRQDSLELVNEARERNGLASLELQPELNEAAQAHAQDMLRRNYYAHVTPEGRTVRDRYVAAGGSRSLLVAENIARCQGCAAPADEAAVQSLHEGWMESPGHRENILTEGLAGYGFGLAEIDGRRYAVQTFSGPGSPQGLEAGEAANPIDASAQTARAANVINDRRAGGEKIAAAPALVEAARAMIPQVPLSDVDLDRLNPLAEVVPQDAAWRTYRTIVGSCGGCGMEATDVDVEFFIGQWFDQPSYRDILTDPSLSSIGLNIEADGSGRIAVLLAG